MHYVDAEPFFIHRLIMKTFVVDLTDVDEDELHEETANVLMFIVDRLHSGVNKELLGVALSEAMREFLENPSSFDVRH
jgi:hypothetical protein